MASESQFSLLKENRFRPFFLTQFFGAFNDNVFKNALIILIAFQGTAMAASSDTLVNLAAGLFILPFFLFSATAGQFADKYEKSRLIRWVKILEIFIMVAAAVAFFYSQITMLIAILFLMGTQSTIFGPVKYGILPQHLKDSELVGGNGLVEMGTFLAILLGTILGGILIGIEGYGRMFVSAAIILCAFLGYLSSRKIPLAAASDPQLKINWNPLTETWKNLKFTRQNRTVYLSILGISWFWFYGATFLAQLPNYTKVTIGGNEQVVTLMLTLFSLSIGVGSLLCERMSGKRIELGLVPFGSIGLTVFGIDLYFAEPAAIAAVPVGAVAFLSHAVNWRIVFDMLMVGLFGGFFIVPLYALIQKRSEPSHRARIIAGNNIINSLFMVASAAMAIVLLKAGFTIPELFLITGLLNALVAIYIYSLVPEFLLRFLVWIAIHTIYRVKKEGMENIPKGGATILVCNHVSFIDALIISGCVRRPIRFIMDYHFYNLPIVSFLFKAGKAIPIGSAREKPELLKQAFADIREGLEHGDILCIFPEGRITHDGELNVFKPGIEKIVGENPVPVVPMALRGLWGSFFSRKWGPAMLTRPRRLWSKIELVVGKPIPPEQVTAAALQNVVSGLRGDRL